MQSAISVRNLSKVYAGGFAALKDVSLEIRPGEILALLGPNGAGKTMLISIISGTESLVPQGGISRTSMPSEDVAAGESVPAFACAVGYRISGSSRMHITRASPFAGKKSPRVSTP
jgi:ABC-type sulfate/molybdate transport systems ATPase subunit